VGKREGDILHCGLGGRREGTQGRREVKGPRESEIAVRVLWERERERKICNEVGVRVLSEREREG
jgi:hypothetical protein